jgi:hypothetical protein
MVRYTLEQRVLLNDTYMKYESARNCQQKFWRKFCDKRVPSRQTIHSLVNKLKLTGLLIDKKWKHKHWVLSEEKLDDIGARLVHTPRKSLKHPAQETKVSKSSARRATQLLKLKSYKTTVNHLRLAATWSSWQDSFFSWFLQSTVEGEIDPQLTFFSDEVWFRLEGYINKQNNRYWSSQNPHLPTKSCSIRWKLVSHVL